MLSFFVILCVCTVMVMATNLIYYEMLRYTWYRIPSLNLHPHLGIVYVIIAIFMGHTLMIWLYAAAYYGVIHLAPSLGAFGHLAGVETASAQETDFVSLLYFSAVSYSSLGFGDIIPKGHLRILAGVEAVNGLMLIGWSVTFTYLLMERFWALHTRRHRRFFKDDDNAPPTLPLDNA